jgi:hypothetical protein
VVVVYEEVAVGPCVALSVYTIEVGLTRHGQLLEELRSSNHGLVTV